MSVYGDRDTGVQNRTTSSLQESLQPQSRRVSRPSAIHPQVPDPQRPPGGLELAWKGTNLSQSSKSQTLRDLLGDWSLPGKGQTSPRAATAGPSQEVKSQERLRDESPLKPSKKQGMCPFGGGCGYVRTQFTGLDVFWSPLKASSRELVEQNISRGCKHLLKR